MFLVVIPAMNEAKNLTKVISKLPMDVIDLVVPVLNGCTDDSLRIIQQLHCPGLAPLCFSEPLGIDVPRAVGAVMARDLRAGGALFLDGDMHGVAGDALKDLILMIRNKNVDLALTNCYPERTSKNINPTAASLLTVREKFNRQLGLWGKIGFATPSHGPHAVSGKFLQSVNPADFAIPPRLLVSAVKSGLQVEIGAETPHLQLGSSLRSPGHVNKIVETIIGDCLEAVRSLNGLPGGRSINGKEYLGYHSERRWDLLELFKEGEIGESCFR